MTIKPEDFAKELESMMSDYSEEILEVVEDVTQKVGTMVMDEIKEHITFDEPTGEYVKSFSLKKEKSRTNRGRIWHVLKPHYRLTHLLEKGHALKSGGRTRAFPHIKYGEELAVRRYPEMLKEAIEKNAKR